jgi:exonuclease SbcD
MRFLHTSDWHLGKTLCNASLLEDQAFVLDHLVTLLRDTQAEALVVAGDLYDRAVPPKEAVALLDDVLHRIVRGLGLPVLLIAGNHDSPERLGFAADLLEAQGLHVAGPLEAEPKPVVLGQVAFHLMPYADPAAARHALQEEAIHTHQEVLAAQMRRARQQHPEGCRFVAVAHAFVTGGEGSDSELGLAVGGTGEVEARLFQGCDYAALGHLHRPQATSFPQVRYAGSLLKFSASEAAQGKSVTLVDLPTQGALHIECLPLTPRRDLRRIRGHFEDLLKAPQGNPDDYLFLELLDEGPVLDAMARLRQLYPNILGIQPAPAPLSPSLAQGLASSGAFPGDLDPATLFEAFFKEVQGRPMNDEERALLREVATRQASAEEHP